MEMYPTKNQGTMEAPDKGEEGAIPSTLVEKSEVNEEGQRNSSSAPESSVDRWGDEIPPELLRMIFEKLMIDDGQTLLVKRKQVLLNCRETHPRWNTVMDSLLEEKCLETWTKCELSLDIMLSDHLFNLTLLLAKPTGEEMVDIRLEWVFCPPSVYQGGETDNPFPTKSLTVAPYYSSNYYDEGPESKRAKRCIEDFKVMRVLAFFSKFGHHLTSLVLTNISLAFETFQGILGHTAHLRALTLYSVCIDIDLTEERFLMKNGWSTASSSYPPPLPQLQHLRFLDTQPVEESYEGREERRSLLEWLLEPYHQQLLTLDVDIYSRKDFGVAPFNFAALKRLSMWRFNDFNFLRGHMSYPKLESLSLEPIRLRLQWHTLEWLQWHLAPFAETLVELHLKLHLPPYKEGRYNWSDEEDDDEDERDLLPYAGNECFKEFQWSKEGIVFPKLKSLSILFSMFLNEEKAVKDMLKCLPNLETLNLLRSNTNWESSLDVSEGDVEYLEQFLNQESNDWKACKKLQKVRVMAGVSEKSVFFTKRLPDMV